MRSVTSGYLSPTPSSQHTHSYTHKRWASHVGVHPLPLTQPHQNLYVQTSTYAKWEEGVKLRGMSCRLWNSGLWCVYGLQHDVLLSHAGSSFVWIFRDAVLITEGEEEGVCRGHTNVQHILEPTRVKNNNNNRKRPRLRVTLQLTEALLLMTLKPISCLRFINNLMLIAKKSLE